MSDLCFPKWWSLRKNPQTSKLVYETVRHYVEGVKGYNLKCEHNSTYIELRKVNGSKSRLVEYLFPKWEKIPRSGINNA